MPSWAWGLIGEIQNDSSSATDAYRRALLIDPTNFAATTGLGRLGALPSGHPGASPTAAPASSPSAGSGS